MPSLRPEEVRRDSEAAAIGFAEAEHEEVLASDRREVLACRVSDLPAGDLTRVLTKLTFVLAIRETREGDDEFR